MNIDRVVSSVKHGSNVWDENLKTKAPESLYDI